MGRSETFDYVIVGAGSAGCVLAGRLSEDPDVRVLLLEAGPVDHAWDWRLHMPAALAYPLQGRRYNWAYESEPEPHMDGRRMHCPRGRVLGGSSSINGMAYVRGHARDYDRWAQAGLPGWSYAQLLPYFKRAESREAGGDLYRGSGGPLHVATGACRNPLYRAFIAAGCEAGYPVTADMNGCQQEGFGAMDRTTRRGRRWSAAKAYLRPALRRPNLTLRTGALTTRVRLEKTRAVGVDYASNGGVQEARAEREVILSGGAINSPQLLLLSGIGAAAELTELGIQVTADLPGVGRNLQDHLEIYVQHACTQPISLYRAQRPWNKLWIGASWLLLGRGIGASNQFEAGGFIRSAAGIEHPDLQYHFLPIAINYDGSNPHPGDGFQAHVGPMRPTSVGRRAAALGRPARAALDPVQLHGNRRRPPRDARRGAADPRDFFPTGLRSLSGRGACPRTRRPERCRDRRLRARQGRERLSPVLQLQDGAGEQLLGRRGRRMPGPRHRALTRGRRLDHAEHSVVQPQRPHHHAGREGRRPDPRPQAARSDRRPGLDRAGLGDSSPR